MTVELKTAFANVSSFEEWFTLLTRSRTHKDKPGSVVFK